MNCYDVSSLFILILIDRRYSTSQQVCAELKKIKGLAHTVWYYDVFS